MAVERINPSIIHDNVVILGAGPCGLGAASELQNNGFDNWQIYDQANTPGGLASTFTTPEGFLFDIGGHVIFSHYEKFDQMCQAVCEQWLEHERNAWVFMKETFIPYPLQRNFGYLPPEDVTACLEGLKEITSKQFPEPENFEAWLQQNFGSGLFKLFMEPYNFKVWAYPPKDLNSQWVGERVAQLTPQEYEQVAQRRHQAQWGPNATFKYPLHDGTGAIWTGLASTINPENIRYNARIQGIDAETKTIYFANGLSAPYDAVVSTIPLDQIVQMVTNTSVPNLGKLAPKFRHSSTHIVGIGMEGHCPDMLKRKSWIYFPESKVPFYRATVISNYSPYMVPEPGKHWSPAFRDQ